jgi:hypothetical protein
MSISPISDSQNPGVGGRDSLSFIQPIAACILGSLTGAVSAAAAGRTLGLIFGGLFAAGLLSPVITAGIRTIRLRLITILALTAPIAAIWLCLVGPAMATPCQWTEITFLLISFAFAAAGMTALGECFRLNPLLSAALAATASVAWLTWPIWLSPAIEPLGLNRAIDFLVLIHPPLVANGVLTFTPPWTEQSIAYRLTLLNQDVPIRLPATALPAIFTHLLVATALFAVSYLASPFTKGAKTAAAKRRDIGPT